MSEGAKNMKDTYQPPRVRQWAPKQESDLWPSPAAPWVFPKGLSPKDYPALYRKAWDYYQSIGIRARAANNLLWKYWVLDSMGKVDALYRIRVPKGPLPIPRNASGQPQNIFWKSTPVSPGISPGPWYNPPAGAGPGKGSSPGGKPSGAGRGSPTLGTDLGMLGAGVPSGWGGGSSGGGGTGTQGLGAGAQDSGAASGGGGGSDGNVGGAAAGGQAGGAGGGGSQDAGGGVVGASAGEAAQGAGGSVGSSVSGGALGADAGAAAGVSGSGGMGPAGDGAGPADLGGSAPTPSPSPEPDQPGSGGDQPGTGGDESPPAPGTSDGGGSGDGDGAPPPTAASDSGGDDGGGGGADDYQQGRVTRQVGKGSGVTLGGGGDYGGDPSDGSLGDTQPTLRTGHLGSDLGGGTLSAGLWSNPSRGDLDDTPPSLGRLQSGAPHVQTADDSGWGTLINPRASVGTTAALSPASRLRSSLAAQASWAAAARARARGD